MKSVRSASVVSRILLDTLNMRLDTNGVRSSASMSKIVVWPGRQNSDGADEGGKTLSGYGGESYGT